ncbi:odorant receptor 49b-like [Trichogramma pretiosum]|uniref:odorant receptor 49b-like n=1 Tax=Trichogramma pretiosum TaxID=7493 RepID=UPI000C718D30|nr:odorant receptor 49b-like [Trichogramma pretiosum]
MNFFQVFVVKFIAGMFEMLGRDMARIHEEIESSSAFMMNKQKIYKIINRKIRDNIRMHQEAIELFVGLREVSQKKFLIIIVILILELCSTGIWFVIVIPYNKFYAAKMAFSMVTVVMILLYLIYSSEDIIYACNQLNSMCYDTKWYLLSVKEKRLILFMILRTENPCTLMAGPTIFMNYETFSAILRFTLSYLMAFYRIMEQSSYLN